MTQLSPHFWLRELCRSETATRRGIYNWPEDPRVIENLERVCLGILEPVREHFGIPFSPNSGYRSLELNRALGSKDTSQHVRGEAVDIEVPGIPNPDLAYWIAENLEFDQLILEFYKPGEPSSGWVHVSLTDDNRNQKLTITRGEGARLGLWA